MVDDTMASHWTSGAFDRFYRVHEPKLRRALVGRFGHVVGADAAQLAMVWAFEHPEEAGSLTHPVAYLFRVGSSKVAERRGVIEVLEIDQLDLAVRDGYPDLDLIEALRALTSRQRTICVLVCGLGWSQAEVAEGLGVTAGTVQDHLARALSQLRARLAEGDTT